MHETSQVLAKQAIDAFTAWVNALQAEQDERLYRQDWTEKYGETVKKVEACKLLSRSPGYVTKLVQTHQVKTTPDGLVLVSSLQEFAEKSPSHRWHMSQKQTKTG